VKSGVTFCGRRCSWRDGSFWPWRVSRSAPLPSRRIEAEVDAQKATEEEDDVDGPARSRASGRRWVRQSAKRRR